MAIQICDYRGLLSSLISVHNKKNQCNLSSLICSNFSLKSKSSFFALRSKLAAAILGGVDKIHIAPGAKVLYLGAASGTSVSHVSDIVGPVS